VPNAHAPRQTTCRPQEGFTYLGLLFMVAILSWGLTVVVDVWEQAARREREEELLHVGHEMRRALQLYYQATGGERLPRQLEDLLKDPRFPGTRRYLRRIYPDPVTGSADWGLVRGQGGLITGIYSKSEEEPLKQAGFEAADLAFEGKKKYADWVFSPALRTGPGTPLPTPAPSTPTGTQPGVGRPTAAPVPLK
jgi:type II secretory pathway pseudopilin PulG